MVRTRAYVHAGQEKQPSCKCTSKMSGRVTSVPWLVTFAVLATINQCRACLNSDGITNFDFSHEGNFGGLSMIEQGTTSSYAQCGTQCQADSTCVAFSKIGNTGTCYHYHGNPSVLTDVALANNWNLGGTNLDYPQAMVVCHTGMTSNLLIIL
jgi:hypothetical protein